MKRRGRILIVDDDEKNVDILCRLLREEYDLETAATGNACLKQMLNFRPHLVLLDIMMPGISGHETCRRIKLSPSGDAVRIILVSAKETIVDRQRGSDVLADDYLIKPFDHGELRAKVWNQFVALDGADNSRSMSEAQLLGGGRQMSPLQQARFAVALERLENGVC